MQVIYLSLYLSAFKYIIYKQKISDNPRIYEHWFKRFTFLIVSNAFFSVDSFFLLRLKKNFIIEVLKINFINFGNIINLKSLYLYYQLF